MAMPTQEFFSKSIPHIEPILLRSAITTLCRQSRTSYDEPASGTLVQIGNRFFILTAGHTIPANPNDCNLWLLNHTPRNPFTEGVPEFVRYRRIQPWPDVGYLEVTSEIVDTYLACEPCPIGRLACIGAGRENRHLAIVGSPSDFARPITTENVKGIVAQIKPFLSVPLPYNEWPTVPDEAPVPNAEVDLFIPFVVDDLADIRSGRKIQMTSPIGYSGGGVWDLGFDLKKLWSADDVRLIAIQSSWYEEGKYIRAVQVHHWVRMIFEDYPDLRELLKEQFPEQFVA